MTAQEEQHPSGIKLKLTLTKEGRALEHFEFGDLSRVLVGRSEDSEVRIENASVSRHHCEIVREEGFHRLADLGSSHGTFVNGKRASQSSLNSGDVITVGEFNLNYIAEFPKAAVALPPVHGPLTVELGGQEQGGSGRATPRVKGHLTLEASGQNLLLQKDVLLIGRADNADLRLEGWLSPRVAALILRERFAFVVIDTSPRRKMLEVNGQRVRSAELRHGDLIVIKGLRMRFYKGLPRLDDAPRVSERTKFHPGGA